MSLVGFLCGIDPQNRFAYKVQGYARHFGELLVSIRLMTAVWDLQADSHTQKLVLLALADNASDEGVCWPSIGTIAAKTQLSKQGVRDQIVALVEKGWLKVKARYTPDHDRTSNEFTLTIPAANYSRPKQERAPSTRLTTPVNTVDHPHSTRLTTVVNAVDPESSSEPSGEPSNKRGRPFRKFPSEAAKSIPVIDRMLMEIELRGDRHGKDAKEFDRLTRLRKENQLIMVEV